jgi:vacuolar-type H+-ATPase subunit C/Vma6
MLTIEEFIEQKKKTNKLDEFDFQKHTENMTSVIQYVMEYFNEYLNPETYDYERIKLEQTIDKLKKDLPGRYPESLDAIIDFFVSSLEFCF